MSLDEPLPLLGARVGAAAGSAVDGGAGNTAGCGSALAANGTEEEGSAVGEERRRCEAAVARLSISLHTDSSV